MIVSDSDTPSRKQSASDPAEKANGEGPEEKDEEECKSASDQHAQPGTERNCSQAAKNTTDQMLVIEKSAIDLIPLQSLLTAMLAALAATFMVVGGGFFRGFVWN